ncbi:MAG: hypothetical protein QOF15_1934, partial [Mycobacterium sp.]|nr:hypothetical protein [Mycobacterium sp.]
LLGGAALRSRHRLRLWCRYRWRGLGRRTGGGLQILVDAAGQIPHPAIQDRVLLIGAAVP